MWHSPWACHLLTSVRQWQAEELRMASEDQAQTEKEAACNALEEYVLEVQGMMGGAWAAALAGAYRPAARKMDKCLQEAEQLLANMAGVTTEVRCRPRRLQMKLCASAAYAHACSIPHDRKAL